MTGLSSWIYFNLFLLVMLALDLGLSGKKGQKVSFKQSLLWTMAWIALALGFNYFLYVSQGPDQALDFLTGYVIEKSLSIDNIFVILLIFQYFAIPDHLQHRVLFWGVLGALVMRIGFIFIGVQLMAHLHWIIYVFGAILLVTGIKMGIHRDQKADLGNSFLVRLIKKIMPVSSHLDSDRFFTKIDGRTWATPLFLCLMVVEASDLIFAIDSIPAVLAITTDEFIVYSSNAFAILGLRSLYFSLSGMVKLFTYLHYALSFILSFIGVKMLIAEFYVIPTFISLGVILSALAISMLISLVLKPKTLTRSSNELV